MAELLLAVRDASLAPKWGGTFDAVPSPFALYNDRAYRRWLLAAGFQVRAVPRSHHDECTTSAPRDCERGRAACAQPTRCRLRPMATHHSGVAGLVRRLTGAWAPWLQAAGDRKHEWALDVATLYHSRVGTTDGGDIVARSHLLDVRWQGSAGHAVHGNLTRLAWCTRLWQIVATKAPPNRLGSAPDGQEPFTIAFVSSDKKRRKFFRPLGDLARRHGVRVVKLDMHAAAGAGVGDAPGDTSPSAPPPFGTHEHEYADVIMHKVRASVGERTAVAIVV